MTLNTDLPHSRGIHAAVAFVLGATCVPLLESSLVPTPFASFATATAMFTVGRRELAVSRMPMQLKNTCALVVGLPLLIAVVAIAIWQRGAQTSQLNMFHSLDRQSVSSITFYNAQLNSSDPLATIDDPESLTAFVVAARDMRRHSAGALGATEGFQEWRVVAHLSNNTDLKLTWSHRARFPDEVIGRFVRTTPSSELSLGGFRSRGLRAWFTKYAASELGTVRRPTARPQSGGTVGVVQRAAAY